MYLTKEQINRRLNNNITVEPKSRSAIQGARQGRETKVLMGVLAKFDTQKNIAETFGTTQQNISLISKGLYTPTKFDPSLKKEIDAATPKTEEVSNKALDVLMSAIGVVGNTIGETKRATEASMVARNMASVYREMSPASTTGAGSNRIQININAPNQKKENDYESMEVINVS